MTARRRPGTTDRRTFLKTAGAVAGTAVAAGFPAVLRAQAPTVKIGTLHCVTGPLAEPGQACRLGAQMAADAINAAGGIKSMGGARIELLLGDTQTKADVARAEAERLVNAGAQLLMGTFNSGDTAAVVPVAQQRRVPFQIDKRVAHLLGGDLAQVLPLAASLVGTKLDFVGFDGSVKGVEIEGGDLVAIPVPGHTKGSVVFLATHRPISRAYHGASYGPAQERHRRTAQ